MSTLLINQTVNSIYHNQNDNKQLLDELEHDIVNYQNRGLCYLPKPKAEADNTDTRVHIMRKPNTIIFLLYIFHIIHPQKRKRSAILFLRTLQGLSNQADVELDMINVISAADITFIMSSYCELIECSRPIRFFIVSLMYNNNLLLTEREGRTGEYWPEVVAVRTERSEVRTKTTEGQYSTVRLEKARLVSSLLYGTLWLALGGLHLKMLVFSIYL